MRKQWCCRIGILLVSALVLGGGWQGVWAQDEGATLTLLSVDVEAPALFQLLARDEAPTSDELQARLTVSTGAALERARVYVAVENSGWSQGALGLISDQLDPDAEYVALEVRDLGMAGYVVQEDGQAVVFPLHYEADLDGEGTPGFRFDILIGEIQTLRVFRVVEAGGLMLFARESTLTGAGREQTRVTLSIDPEPVFGDLLFECHIMALPEPAAVEAPTPTATPSVVVSE